MNPLAHIGFERRRQIQIRKAFEAGLERQRAGNEDLGGFLLACGRYLVTSIDRLDRQDQMISDLLRERAGDSEPDLGGQLDFLDDRQIKCRNMMQRFASAVDQLEQDGPSALDSFLAKSEEFVAEFTGMMAPRKNPLAPYTEKYFGMDDWAKIADWTDDARVNEEKEFSQVERLAPDGIDPGGYTAEHLPN